MFYECTINLRTAVPSLCVHKTMRTILWFYLLADIFKRTPSSLNTSKETMRLFDFVTEKQIKKLWLAALFYYNVHHSKKKRAWRANVDSALQKWLSLS